ncbi:sensor histidine kinase [Leptolyngbya sp. 7M]|uniref:sensor histidine kinase n=1 Tax=Leptolyngbya sp. 7M TaxID=2812896 RepID=UPI001B8D6232|nr:ATP-binding protein [Leptolyngbya sp. 7M]QYO63745.1 ATP-binding protein [Leptolyngbya sp. 7M]
MINEMLTALREMPSAQGKQLQFRSSLSPAIIMADKDKLKQVVINLISNAFEATNPGETVTLTLERIAPQRLCMQVHNAGKPIPADVLPKLTKPFFTTKANGNGLGLAIVKRIVEAHQGKLFIESAEDIGTQIKVYLPLK